MQCREKKCMNGFQQKTNKHKDTGKYTMESKQRYTYTQIPNGTETKDKYIHNYKEIQNGAEGKDKTIHKSKKIHK